MKRKITLTLILSVLLYCAGPAQEDSTNSKPMITLDNKKDLEKYVGALITIKGEVSNTKIPAIIGVDVSSDSPDLRGKTGIATGILEKWVVLEDDIDIYTANRGAGTFYRLRDPKSTYEAQVQEIKKTTMLGLRTVVYKVGDLNKAKQWYAKAFQTKPYFDEPFYVGFSIGRYELGLLPEENPTTDKTDNTITYWGVNEIEKEYNRLIKAGATEHEKPTNVGGDLMVASVKDPWGNVIGLIYNPEFKLEE